MPSLPANEIQDAIAKAGFAWKARDNRISSLVRDRPAGTLFGLSISEPERLELMQASVMESSGFSAAVPAPPEIDWRSKNGNFVTPIRFQATCGACVSFATCAALESRMLIANATPGENIDLSEAHLFSCGGGKCSSGWNFEPALQQAQTSGVGLEAQFPYQSHDVACIKITPVVKVTGWIKQSTMNARKFAIAQNGPVIAGMRVFSDFYSYSSGVYKHATGQLEGLHAVAVIGYSDQEGCWVCKNSWDADWGDRGFFRIGYGECGIDSEFPFFDPDIKVIGALTS